MGCAPRCKLSTVLEVLAPVARAHLPRLSIVGVDPDLTLLLASPLLLLILNHDGDTLLQELHQVAEFLDVVAKLAGLLHRQSLWRSLRSPVTPISEPESFSFSERGPSRARPRGSLRGPPRHNSPGARAQAAVPVGSRAPSATASGRRRREPPRQRSRRPCH